MFQGAAEIVLQSCTHVTTSEGDVAPLDERGREDLGQCVTDMASKGLRTLCLSYRDLDSAGLEPPAEGVQRPRPADEGLTACCIVGIKVGLHTLELEAKKGLVKPHQWHWID